MLSAKHQNYIGEEKKKERTKQICKDNLTKKKQRILKTLYHNKQRLILFFFFLSKIICLYMTFILFQTWINWFS